MISFLPLSIFFFFPLVVPIERTVTSFMSKSKSRSGGTAKSLKLAPWGNCTSLRFCCYSFCFFASLFLPFVSDKKLSFSCVKYIKKPIILNDFKNIVRKPKNYWLLRNITCLKYRRYTGQILSSNVIAKEIVWYETSRLNRITLGNVSCSLTRLRRSHAQKGVVLLGDAKRRCDTTYWDKIMLRCLKWNWFLVLATVAA